VLAGERSVIFLQRSSFYTIKRRGANNFETGFPAQSAVIGFIRARSRFP